MFNMKELVRNDHCLLIPWFIINTVFIGIVFVGACIFTVGFSKFCFSFNQNMGKSCRSVQFHEWPGINTRFLFDYLMVSSTSMWLHFFNLILVDTVIFLRIMCVIKFIEYQLHDQEILTIKYYRILRHERIKKSYDIDLPMEINQSEDSSFRTVDGSFRSLAET